MKTEGGIRDFEPLNEADTIEALRAFASTHRDLFLRFRCTIARNFLAEMRKYARSLKPDALTTAMDFYFEDRRPVPVPDHIRAALEGITG